MSVGLGTVSRIQYLLLSLAFLALVLSFQSNAAQGADLIQEIGSPLYVLQNSPSSSLQFWEIRPYRGPHAQSRLLYSGPSFPISAFGLAGFKITPQAIQPGSLFTLDPSGRIYRIELDLDPTYRTGRGKVSTIGRDFILLEKNAAEESLFAIKDGVGLIEIQSSGEWNKVASLEEQVLGKGRRIARMTRTKDGNSLYFLTKDLQLIEWSFIEQRIVWRVNPPAPSFHADGISDFTATTEGLWVVAGESLFYYDFQSETWCSQDLTLLFGSEKNGKITEILRTQTDPPYDRLYLRIGNHVYIASISKTSSFTPTHLKGIAFDYFSKSLRNLGVPYDLFTQTLVLRPRTADLSGQRRFDIQTIEVDSVNNRQLPPSLTTGDLHYPPDFEKHWGPHWDRLLDAYHFDDIFRTLPEQTMPLNTRFRKTNQIIPLHGVGSQSSKDIEEVIKFLEKHKFCNEYLSHSD